MTAEQIENHEEMLAAERAYNNQLKRLDMEELHHHMQIQEARLAATSSMLSALGDIIAASGDESKSAAAAQKVLAIAQIAIDTAVAVSGAIRQAQTVGYPANIAAIASGVASVLAAVGQATAILNKAKVPGPSATVPTVSTPTGGAPSTSAVSTNTTQIADQTIQQAELAPIQAFVVETEITGSQGNVSQIQQQATFP